MRESLAENYTDLIKAVMLLQSDKPNAPVDTLYLHGLSEGMINSTVPNLIEIAADYQKRQLSRYISFNGSDGEGMGEQNYPGAAWPGKDWYYRKLVEEDTNYYSIVPTNPGLHTRDEADKFIEKSKERSWKSGAILSVGYHCVRSISCMIAAMETQNYFMFLHFITPPQTNPWYSMVSSQGLKRINTFDEIDDEIKRIFSYWDKGGANPPESWRSGYAVPPKYLFHYLRNRDEIVNLQKFPLFPFNN